MLNRPLAVFAAALALAVAPASALAKPDDVAATRAYIRAHYVFVQAVKAKLAAEQAAAAALVSEVRSRCANVVAGSPRNEDATALSAEVLIVVSDAMLTQDRAAIMHFLGAVKSLRWSSSTLTHAVARYAATLKAEVALKPPNLCSDLSAWAATGFLTLPVSVTRSNQESEAAAAGPQEVPPRLLAPYTRSDDKTILHRTKLLEQEVEAAALKTGLQAWSQILSAVGLGA